MTKIVLYSGGLDSYIGWWLLRQETGWQPVYFKLNTPYTWKEVKYMPQADEVVFSSMLDLRHIEGIHIPQRNVLLCAAAQSIFNADEVALCSVADDIYPDNNIVFHRRMSQLLTHTAQKAVQVFSPFMLVPGHGMTKTQAVSQYLKLGGDARMLQMTISCYDPNVVQCGTCRACMRREGALVANKIDPSFPPR
jgi:7-cyano-7-deazaguanine synthase in queuosine biosynthesis